MEVIHPRCAGIDISTKDAKVCVRVAGAGRPTTVETVTTWSSMTGQILALRDHLIGEQPRHNESAGKVRSATTRPGNPYLQGALGAAAMACAENPSTYLGSRYRRIATRRGPQKANVATQRAMLTAIWHMGTTGAVYDDPGADSFTRLHPERAKNRAIHQLQAMGFRVTLDSAS